jgi:hypothetical protein
MDCVDRHKKPLLVSGSRPSDPAKFVGRKLQLYMFEVRRVQQTAQQFFGSIAQWQSNRLTCDRQRLESSWNPHLAPIGNWKVNLLAKETQCWFESSWVRQVLAR